MYFHIKVKVRTTGFVSTVRTTGFVFVFGEK